jgi:hypothetical protein
MTVDGWCPNHESGATDRIATSGKTARSTRLAEHEVVIGDKYSEAFPLSGLRSASSQVPETNARLSCRAAPLVAGPSCNHQDLSFNWWEGETTPARCSPRHGFSTGQDGVKRRRITVREFASLPHPLLASRLETEGTTPAVLVAAFVLELCRRHESPCSSREIRQYLILQALLFCALAALVVGAGETAWLGHSDPARLAGAMVAAPLVILLLAASVGRVQALLPENQTNRSSEPHAVAPQATRIVDWMAENVPEGQHLLIPPAYSLNRYVKFLDGRRHEWTFMRLDQEPCKPRPNSQMRCPPDEREISRIPPDAIWVHVGHQCKTSSLSMSSLLDQVRRTRSGYVMISGGYKFPGFMELPSRLQESGAFEIIHSELDKGASGRNESLVLLKSTGRAPEAVPP